MDAIHSSFPRALISYLHGFLAASLNHIQSLYPTFAHYYLSAVNTAPHTSEDEAVELPQLICPIFDFVASVMRGGKARDWLEGANLSGLVIAVFNLVQMTDDDVNVIFLWHRNLWLTTKQEATWAENANAFVAQEEDETQSYSVRVAGFDLLGVGILIPSFLTSLITAATLFQCLIDRAPAQITRTFQTATEQVIQTSFHVREAGQQNW